MKQQFQSIYRQLQADTDLCRQRDMPELERIECCFRTASGCWGNMREALNHYRFTTEEEEIDFFRNIKPLFTSQIEFYTLVYQAILFKPQEDLLKIAAFWAGESARLHRFCENKEAFIAYYKSGDTGLDSQYFLRHNNKASCSSAPRVYDKNHHFSTSHDWLVAALIAQEMYHAYTMDKLKEMGSVS
jgi:hypothetical protein